MPVTEEARREAVDKAMQAYAEGPAHEAIQLPYKDGAEGPFSVIKVALDAVVYNPGSHRIKSQLESHPKRDVVKDDPYGEEAQSVIHEILLDTEDFKELQNNLEEYGQRDPGVVTRAGLMVNANTRLAALREIDPHGFIRAAVLPSDADDKSIDRLELELQVQRDFKQDYTFTNELLFINELLDKHEYSVEDAAKALNWAASGDEKELRRGKARVQQAVRLYALARRIQGLSDGAIPLVDLDDKRQILIDIDERYEKVKDTDPAGAERMREARILGMLSGCFYRDLRTITGTTAMEHLLGELEEVELLEGDVQELTTPEREGSGGGGENGAYGDSGLLTADEQDIAEEKSFAPLVKLVATSQKEEYVQLPSGERVDVQQLRDELATAFENSAESIKTAEKEEKDLGGPVKNLSEALKKLRTATEGYQEVHAEEGFKHGKIGYLLKKIKTQVEVLEKAVDESKDGE